MSCFTITVCALAFLGADEKLAPQARLECAGEVVGAALTPDGKTLFGVARNGGLYDLAAWGVPSGSKTVLARGTDGALIASSNDERSLLSPDGKSLAGFILDKHGKAYDVNVVAWEVPSMSKTPLFVMKGEKFVSLTGAVLPGRRRSCDPGVQCERGPPLETRCRGEMERLKGVGRRAKGKRERTRRGLPVLRGIHTGPKASLRIEVRLR